MENLERLIRQNAETLGLTKEDADAAAAAYRTRQKLANSFYREGVERKNFLQVCYDFLEKKYGGAFALAVTLLLVSTTKEIYCEKGIPENVFWDTMSDIKTWSHNYRVTDGTAGVGELGWLKNHFKLDIFRIGRLQFQFTKITHPKFLAMKGFRFNEPALFVHIPQGMSLNIAEVKASFLAANEFFATYFPDFKYRYYFTETWLLYEDNKKFMRADSNIIKFASLFRVVDNFNQAKEAEKRIFGAEYQKSSDETSLQKSCRAHLQNGGKIGVGLGYIAKDSDDLT